MGLSKRKSIFQTRGQPSRRCVSRTMLGTYHEPADVLGPEYAGVRKTGQGMLGIDQERLQSQLPSPIDLWKALHLGVGYIVSNQ